MSFLIKINKNEKHYKELYEPTFKYGFLILLFLVTLSSLNFDFINNIEFLKKFIDFLKDRQFLLTLITIFFGFFTFYFNRERVEKEIDQEQTNEEKAEKKREKEFLKKYPKINKIWVLRHILKWMYKEGWVYMILLLFLTILFFSLRLYDTNFINGSDNYNVLGIKNLYENGISYYKYSPITDYLMLKSVQIFGFNFLSIKLPFILYSFITFIFLFLIVRIFDKKLALLSLFLYTISPWAIIQSNITRDYSFDLMITSITIYLSFIIYNNIKHFKKIDKNFYLNLFYFSLIPIIIIFLYKFIRFQVLIIGIYVLIASLVIGFIILKKININKIFGDLYIIFILPIIIIAAYLIDRAPFNHGFHKPNLIFLEMFFDPYINSPWQWFHNINLQMIFFISIFILGIFFIKKEYKPYIFILLGSFIFGLFLYIFKYKTHIEYIPVRYVYFLFIPYVIIISKGILNLFYFFKKRNGFFIIIVLVLCFFNITALNHTIKPSLAYEKEGISNLKIDNVGIGRFNLIDVVDYMKNELNITDETTIVLDGRYEEIILYSGRKMDGERALLRPGRSNWTYDVAQNTYVQSTYFGYDEIMLALKNNKEGYYISHRTMLSIPKMNKTIHLNEKNFTIEKITFTYINTVNEVQFYYWNSLKNNSPN